MIGMGKYNLHWNGGFSGDQLFEDGVPENWENIPPVQDHASCSMNV
jgi:hypothetical protein